MDSTKAILILVANPRQETKRRLAIEIREIELGLQQSQGREKFTIQHAWAVSADDLRRAMLRFKPHIVHFCGYGLHSKGIELEHDESGVHLVSTQALSDLFKLFADQVECVLLSACYTDLQAEAISRHINYVIGMKQEISHEAATHFSVGFYDALGADKSYKEAFEFGCNSIQLGIRNGLSPISEEETPVLKERSSRVEWNLSLDPSLEDWNSQKAAKLVESMQQAFGDPFIALKDVDVDEAILVLESSEERFHKIEALFEQEQLEMFLKTPFQIDGVSIKAPTVLILEDDELWLSRHERRLKEGGILCHATQYAEEAIRIAKMDFSIKFALIDEILFVPPVPLEAQQRQLQRWQGSGVIREITLLRSDLKFIVVTSAPEQRSKGKSQLFRRELNRLKVLPGVVDVVHQQDIQENPEAAYSRLISLLKRKW